MNNELVDEVVEFLTTSDFWKTTLEILDDDDVVFHESRVETSLDPVALEYLFREILRRRGADVRNVGHAVHGDLAWIKMYPVGAPIFNLTWRYRADTILAPYAQEPFATWRHSEVDAYIERFRPRLPTAADVEVVQAYLASEHWRENMLAKIADPEIEHFHVYLDTDLDPRWLEVEIRGALRQAGVTSWVPPFLLANADHERPGLWVGHAPDGTTSWEVTLYHTPGTVLEPVVLNAEQRSYGGDGWTNEQYKQHLEQYPTRRLTINEADAILARIA